LSSVRGQVRVTWRKVGATRSGPQGKPCCTWLRVLAHASHRKRAASLVAIQIVTGRRHQIRSHASHIGHPTWRDGKYTTPATLRSDLKLCAWNFLHRYRLAFHDSARVAHEVLVSLPTHLATALQQLAGKGRQSSLVLCCWSHGLDLQAWTEYEALTPAVHDL